MTWNYELFIDGKWTSESAEGSIDVVDPATEEVIGSVPEATTKDCRARHRGGPPCLRRGPVALHEAVGAGRQVDGDGRDPPSALAGDLRELIIAETGSTGFLTDMVQARGSIGMFRSNAAIADIPSPGSRTTRRPAGPPE